MKIAITGGTGMIGKRLCRSLLKKDHDVRLLVRNVKDSREKIPYPVEFLKWDGSLKGLPAGALEGCDVIVHLAGEPVAGKRWSEEQKKKIIRSRVDTAAALISRIEKSVKKPKAFICGSAIGIYGDRGDEILTEDSSAGSGFLAEVCEQWEAVTLKLDSMGVRRVNVRTGIVLSHNEGAMGPLLPLFKTGLGGPIGGGQQWMSWIHVDDMINVFVHLIENHEARGAYNGVAPKPVTNQEFSLKLGSALHRPAVMPAPAFAVRAAMGEMSDVVLASQRVMPQKLTQEGFQFRFIELSSAFENLLEVDQLPGQKELYAEQWVPKKVSEVFPFFSEAKNLGVLTPEFLNFKIRSQSTEKVEQGTLIEYTLKVHGLPLFWRTEIEEWAPNDHFVDNQLKGPYKKWHHRHGFEAMKGGTLLTDRVHYQLPLGTLGGIVGGAFVKRDVQSIFKYRRKVIEEKFGKN